MVLARQLVTQSIDCLPVGDDGDDYDDDHVSSIM